MIIETENPIEIANDKGAIIVGKNSSGKSTIIRRILECKQKIRNKNEYTVFVDGDAHTIKYFGAYDSPKKTFEGTSSSVNKIIKDINTEICENIPQPVDVFNDTILNKYREDIKKISETYDAKDILKSGIDIEYLPKMKTNDLYELEVKLTVDGEIFDLSDASTGVKQIVGQFLEINRNATAKELLLLDEPDAFFHPSWYKLLAVLLKDSIKKGKKVIMVTHNAHFLSLLIEENVAMVSYIEKGITRKDGKVITINYNDILAKYHTFRIEFLRLKSNGKSKGESIEISDKRMRLYMTPEICEGFFTDKSVIVEGATEEYFLRHKTNVPVITAHGYYQYYLIALIYKEMGKKPCFIIDTDIDKRTKTIFGSNQYTEDEIKALGFKVMRMNEDFDVFLTGSKVEKYEKIEKVLEMLINEDIPVDPHGEWEGIKEFIK